MNLRVYVINLIRYELEDLEMKPDQEPLLVEQIHAAAFKHNTLGLPKICPEENVGKISRQTLYTYLKAFHRQEMRETPSSSISELTLPKYFRPERMVVAGVGVDHDTLVEAAQRHFVDQRPVWETQEYGVAEVQTDRSIAQYTGGIVSREKDLSDVSLGPTPMPELGHIVIGLQSKFFLQ